MKYTEYVDERGFQYRVMPGIGLTSFKGRYKKPDVPGWHGMQSLPWRITPEAAQQDLDLYANERGLEATHNAGKIN